MTNSFKSILSFVALTLSSAYLTSCIPNVARTDARIEPGWTVGGAAGYSATLDTPRDESGRITTEDPTRVVAGEFDLQYGQKKEGKLGYAIQLKVPVIFVAATLDTYLQLPSPKKFNYGVGAELNALLPGIYGVMTADLSSKYAVSTTLRALYPIYQTDARPRPWSLNPQLAIISKFENVKLSAFASYMYSLGNGIEEASSIGPDSGTYFAKHFMYSGLAVSF